MERIVPNTASEEIELYLRTYYSLLRSSAEVHIRALEEAHAGMNSLLHSNAREQALDMSAFIYSLLRLPERISRVQVVVMGQSAEVFTRDGFGEVETWEMVSAPARRRRYYFDGKDTLACFIVSRSDIDDIIPLLTAFQIEWNKLHRLLRRFLISTTLEAEAEKGTLLPKLAEALQMPPADLENLQTLWGAQLIPNLMTIASAPRRLRVRLLSGSLSQYRRATYAWWALVEETCPEVLDRPVYFVSSNNHSLANLLMGVDEPTRAELLHFLHTSGDENLIREWRDIEEENVPSNQENFFYYLLKKYAATPAGRAFGASRRSAEAARGITRIPGRQSFDVETQVIDLSRLNPEALDPRLGSSMGFLCRSDALILNIDYPLGMAAYHILTQVAERVREMRGIYIQGKAATLNGVAGDVMIPNVVHDEQSKNTYIFPNSFTAADISPYLIYGTVLDNQKAVTVRGTFLQTAQYMDIFYREGYTDIEMEAGPYLSAVYEMYRPKRYPSDEIINLMGIPFDLGILHYASDKPLSKGKNLGAGSLSYFGMDPAYATSLAILRRIFHHERNREKERSPAVSGKRARPAVVTRS